MALALAMQLLGLFERGDARLQQSLSWILSDSFQTAVSEPVLFMVAAMFSFGIAFAVLDSPAAWRRIVLGLTALVLVLGDGSRMRPLADLLFPVFCGRGLFLGMVLHDDVYQSARNAL